MIRIKLGEFIYDIGYEHGIYFARANIGESPIGIDLNQLACGLSKCTGLQAADILVILNDQFK